MRIFLTVLLLAPLAALHAAAAPLPVELRESNLTTGLSNIERLGINFWGCGEGFSTNMPLLKKRVAENFEGSMCCRFVFSADFNKKGISPKAGNS